MTTVVLASVAAARIQEGIAFVAGHVYAGGQCSLVAQARHDSDDPTYVYRASSICASFRHAAGEAKRPDLAAAAGSAHLSLAGVVDPVS